MEIAKVSKVHYGNVVKKWKSGKFLPIEDRKLRLLLDDGYSIEAGIFSMKSKDIIEHHACISCQVGCKFACEMCSSGKNGFFRNLTTEEMLDEIRLLEAEMGLERLDEILFMGIGEPLDNYDNFVNALKALSRYSGSLSFATVGLPSRLDNLSKESLPAIKMVWISLHASDDLKRSLIMPVNRTFGITDVLASAKKFSMTTSGRVWINYLLFQDFNDTDKDADLLVKLMEGTETHFGLQISAPNNNLANYKASSMTRLESFETKLKSLGLKNDVFCFEPAGKEVKAGCGEFIYEISK